jgi:hypothetical protein
MVLQPLKIQENIKLREEAVINLTFEVLKIG